MNKIIKYTVIFIVLSFIFYLVAIPIGFSFDPEMYIELRKDYLFDCMSVLLGILVTSAGIYLGAILTFYGLSLNNNSSDALVETKNISYELWQNTILGIFLYILYLFLPGFEKLGLSCLSYSQNHSVERTQWIQSVDVMTVSCMFLLLLDTIYATFKIITDQLLKDEK